MGWHWEESQHDEKHNNFGGRENEKDEGNLMVSGSEEVLFSEQQKGIVFPVDFEAEGSAVQVVAPKNIHPPRLLGYVITFEKRAQLHFGKLVQWSETEVPQISVPLLYFMGIMASMATKRAFSEKGGKPFPDPTTSEKVQMENLIELLQEWQDYLKTHLQGEEE